MRRGIIISRIVFGEWAKEDIIFLLENKRNAINQGEDSCTSVLCPDNRKEELVQILKDKFGDRAVSKTVTIEGKTKSYISVDNGRHVLVLKDEGGAYDGPDAHFVMHRK